MIEPGIEPGGVYVVTSGTFEVEDAAATGDDRTPPLRKVGPGGHFGTPLNGAATPANAWVRASEDATAYFVGKDDLQRLAMVSALIGGRGDGAPAG